MKRLFLIAICWSLFILPTWAVNREWTGAAQDKPQITTLSPTGSWATGNTAWVQRNNKRITVTMDATASRKAAVVLLQKAIEASGPGSDTDPNDADGVTGTWDHGGLEYGEFGEIDATADYTDPNAPVLTLTSASLTIDNTTCNGVPFVVTAGDTASGSIGTPTNTQEATGRFHFDAAANWKDPNGNTGAPQDDDTCIFVNGGSVYFGMNDNGALEDLNVKRLNSYQSTIGLPFTNSWQSSRLFVEDRRRLLHLPPTNSTGTHTIQIGEQNSTVEPKGATRIDLGSVAGSIQTVLIYDAPTANGSIEVAGGNSGSVVLNVYSGNVTTGQEPLANTTTLTQVKNGMGDDGKTAKLTIGQFAALDASAQVIVYEGEFYLASASSTTNITQHGGTIHTQASVTTLATVNLYGGTFDHDAQTITTLNIFDGGTFDASSDDFCTLQNVTLHKGGGFKDPKGITSLTNGIDFSGTNPKDPQTTFEYRDDKTWTPSDID